MAQAAIDMGYFVSFAGPVTFLNSRQLPIVAQAVPLGGILIETDSPYLSPHPLRGRRNEPANVALVASRIAELKELPVERVATETSKNARELFGF